MVPKRLIIETGMGIDGSKGIRNALALETVEPVWYCSIQV